MPNQPLYADNYPGSEKFALLCEGDRTGYEAALLRKWRDAEVPIETSFDIWPCGTANGLLAIADAIGRTVRIIVIEDRDFRSPEQAQADSERNFADRERRSVAMRGWTTWARNEVENYFLDEAILIPVMTSVYRCSPTDVLDALDQAISFLSVFQALQGAVAEVRQLWMATEPSSLLVASRPSWTTSGLKAAGMQVEEELIKACERWRSKFYASASVKEPFLGQQLVDSFRARLAKCNAETRTSVEWINNWAGKEILKLVRQQLASRFEGPAREPDRRIPPVQWHELGNNTKRNALDREIERAIQPLLVEMLWEHAAVNVNAPIRADLGRLLGMLRL